MAVIIADTRARNGGIVDLIVTYAINTGERTAVWNGKHAPTKPLFIQGFYIGNDDLEILLQYLQH